MRKSQPSTNESFSYQRGLYTPPVLSSSVQSKKKSKTKQTKKISIESSELYSSAKHIWTKKPQHFALNGAFFLNHITEIKY